MKAKSAKSSKKKGSAKRSPKQIAATKKLVAANKRKARAAKAPAKKPAARKAPKRTSNAKKIAALKQLAAGTSNPNEAEAARRAIVRLSGKSTALARKESPMKKGKKGGSRKRRSAKQRAATAALVRMNKARAKSGHRKPAKRRRSSARKATHHRAKRRGGGHRSRKTIRVALPGARKVGKRGHKRRPARSFRKIARVRSTVYMDKRGRTVTFSSRAKNPTLSWSETVVAILVAGTAFTLADLGDRFLATMKPANGKHAKYGPDASAAILAKPDMKRYGAQVGAAVVTGAGAYMARKHRMVAAVLGALSAGIGAHAIYQALTFEVMPRVLPAADGDEMSLGNRLYPNEQVKPQHALATGIAKVDALGDKAPGQADTLPAAYKWSAGLPWTGPAVQGAGGTLGRIPGRPQIQKTGVAGCGSCGPSCGCGPCKDKYQGSSSSDMTLDVPDGSVPVATRSPEGHPQVTFVPQASVPQLPPNVQTATDRAAAAGRDNVVALAGAHARHHDHSMGPFRRAMR